MIDSMPKIFVKKIDGVRHIYDEHGVEVFDNFLKSGSIQGITWGIPPKEAEYRTVVAQRSPKKFPEVTKQISNFASSMVDWAKNGFPLSTDKERRWSICQSCEDLIRGRCVHCGCGMKAKIYMDTAKCDLKKW